MTAPLLPKPVQFVENREQGVWRITPDAQSFLQSIKGPLSVVAIVGEYRTGKSYLLNRVLGLQDGFSLGHDVEGKTRGIWIWGAEEKTDSGSRTLVCLDTEGLCDPLEHQNSADSPRLFALACLLSSYLILNTKGTITQASLDQLAFAAELTTHVRLKKKRVEEAEAGEDDADAEFATGASLHAHMPQLLWVVRDFTLSLKPGMTEKSYLEQCLEIRRIPGKITAAVQVKETIREFFKTRDCSLLPPPLADGEYKDMETRSYESLQASFQSKCTALVDKIRTTAPVKMIVATGTGTAAPSVPLNGPQYLAYVQSFLDAINSGAVPTLDDAWVSVAKSACQSAFKEALAVYEKKMEAAVAEKAGNPPVPLEYPDLLRLHVKARKEALDVYRDRVVGDIKVQEDIYEELKSAIANERNAASERADVTGGAFHRLLVENEKLSSDLCNGHLEVAKQFFASVTAESYGSYEEFTEALAKAESSLHSQLRGPAKQDAVARFAEFRAQLAERMQIEFKLSEEQAKAAKAEEARKAEELKAAQAAAELAEARAKRDELVRQAEQERKTMEAKLQADMEAFRAEQDKVMAASKVEYEAALLKSQSEAEAFKLRMSETEAALRSQLEFLQNDQKRRDEQHQAAMMTLTTRQVEKLEEMERRLASFQHQPAAPQILMPFPSAYGPPAWEQPRYAPACYEGEEEEEDYPAPTRARDDGYDSRCPGSIPSCSSLSSPSRGTALPGRGSIYDQYEEESEEEEDRYAGDRKTSTSASRSTRTWEQRKSRWHDESLTRSAPSSAGCASAPLKWNEFQKSLGGQGLTRQEIRERYWKQPGMSGRR